MPKRFTSRTPHCLTWTFWLTWLHLSHLLWLSHMDSLEHMLNDARSAIQIEGHCGSCSATETCSENHFGLGNNMTLCTPQSPRRALNLMCIFSCHSITKWLQSSAHLACLGKLCCCGSASIGTSWLSWSFTSMSGIALHVNGTWIQEVIPIYASSNLILDCYFIFLAIKQCRTSPSGWHSQLACLVRQRRACARCVSLHLSCWIALSISGPRSMMTMKRLCNVAKSLCGC